MGREEYKIMTRDDARGFWVYKRELEDLIKLSHKRNMRMFHRLVACWEHLENAQFDMGIINKNINVGSKGNGFTKK